MIDSEVTKLMFFGIEEKVLQQARAGTRSFAEAVMDRAFHSMEVKGRSPSDTDYRHAKAGDPPFSHTEVLRRSLTVAEGTDGKWYAGTRYSEVGLRGVWLEFGGRELKEGQKGGKRKRKLKPHPFIQPALNAELDTFAPRVAGSFTT